MIICGKNMDILKKIKANVYDSCVTDAPYGLGEEPNAEEMLRAWIEHGYLDVKGGGFMGKEWDAFVPQPNFWKEIYRVLKPGGFVLCFFGTRTYDWGVMAMRLAGFEIRDQFAWIYGEGMPKGLDIGKKDEQYKGYHTAIKPAFEPIVLARKPISEKTILANMIKWGTGAYNVGDSMIGSEERFNQAGDAKGTMILAANKTGYTGQNVVGRFPANVLLGHHPDCEFIGVEMVGSGKFTPSEQVNRTVKDEYWTGRGTHRDAPSNYGTEMREAYNCHPECPVRILDEQSGVLKSGGMKETYKVGIDGYKSNQGIFGKIGAVPENRAPSAGGASRFFYCAKPSSDEREVGVKSWEKKVSPNNISGGTDTRLDGKAVAQRANSHPTVKPIALMRYLCKLVTPKGGKIIEPFGGSGTTIVAADLEFFYCDSIEQDQYWCDVGEARRKAWRPQHSMDDFFNA